MREYSEAVENAAELDVLAERADIMIPVMRQATNETADRLEQIINHLFLELLMLILAAIAACLLAALVYRAAVARMQKHDTGARAAR
jgi:ABC-type proline/glycine betaine transport system permease subunit